MLKPLSFKTLINTFANGGLKRATTHFGVVYQIEKEGDLWFAQVTVPRVRGCGGTAMLTDEGVTFAEARKACIDDYTKSGGR